MSNTATNIDQIAAPVVQGVVMPDPCATCSNGDCAKIINPCTDRLWYAHNQLMVSEIAISYYRAGLIGERPGFVPSRVRLPEMVCGEGPYRVVRAEAGEHDCMSNQYGAISVTANNGKQLGVKPAEFEVLEWVRNLNSRVMRARHCMSRYEFPEDRKDFKRWLDAPGPCQRPYRWVNEDNGRLVIDIVKSGKRLCYDIPRQELHDRNWREVVARAVRIVRRAFYA